MKSRGRHVRQYAKHLPTPYSPNKEDGKFDLGHMFGRGIIYSAIFAVQAVIPF